MKKYFLVLFTLLFLACSLHDEGRSSAVDGGGHSGRFAIELIYDPTGLFDYQVSQVRYSAEGRLEIEADSSVRLFHATEGERSALSELLSSEDLLEAIEGLPPASDFSDAPVIHFKFSKIVGRVLSFDSGEAAPPAICSLISGIDRVVSREGRRRYCGYEDCLYPSCD